MRRCAISRRPGAELSPHWQGLSAAMANRSWRIPLWAIAAGAVAIVAGAFFTMRVAIIDEGDAMADELLALSPATPVADRTQRTFVPVKAEAAQASHHSTRTHSRRLASDIKDRQSGGSIRRANSSSWRSTIFCCSLPGRAEIKAEFEPIAGAYRRRAGSGERPD